jgi:hypothetical protein
MMKRMFGAALFVALSAGLAATADAQLVPRPVRFAIGGGLSGVMGDVADGAEPGYHAMAALDLSIPLVPIGVRVDGAFNKFAGRDAGADLRIVNATVNAVFTPLPLPIVKPYVIGGVGMYNAKPDIENFDAVTRMGYNVGAGVRFDLLGLGAFAEARFHHVPENDEMSTTQFYPITVGLRF